MKKLRLAWLMVFSLYLILSCSTDQVVKDNQLVVRFQAEPDRLNPVLSRGSAASQVENFIFQPLAELDPVSLKFSPVLLEKIDDPVIDELDGEGVVDRVDMKIKEDAKWDDGQPITYEDVLFTLKCFMNDEVGVARKKSILSFIKGERHDQNDKKFLSVYLDTAVFNSHIIVQNFHVLPRHIYDSIGYMDDISFNDLIKGDLSAEQNEKLKSFAELFTSETFGRKRIVGSGAYTVENWNTGYEIKLKRKENWYGSKYSDQNLFKALPDEIVYKIIPDQQLAVTALANDNVDLIAGVTPEKFDVLRETQAENYQFLTPVIPQYYYIILNNESPVLSDPQVRKAMAHLVDQQKMIDVVMNGYGKELTAPMLPGGKGYDGSIGARPFDVTKASNLLADAGWSDTNENGTVDKEIDGEVTELQVEFNITGSELSKKIALLLKDNFAQAGIDVVAKSQKFGKSMEEMQSGNFDMVATAASQSLYQANLRPTWHSDGIVKGGGNLQRFSDEKVDEILDELDEEENINERNKLYRQFHRAIHEQTPVLFLLMPTERVLVDSEWEVNASPRRPGYFENLASMK